MTYGVLTILLGLGIFLAPKLLPEKLKKSAQAKDTDKNSGNKNGSGQKKQALPKSWPNGFCRRKKPKPTLKRR